MKKKKLFITIALSLCIFLAAGIIFLSSRLRFTNYIAADPPESAEELNNPYTGWYQIYAYNISDSATFDPSQILEEEPGPGLALLEFNLKEYSAAPVSPEGLALLDQILKNWQTLGRQLILRFLYDWDGNALETEPDNLSLIREHMSQTAKIVNRYSQSVYLLQGIFIGSWGEMHGSRHTGKEDMISLAEHLASVTDENIFLSVRTPDQWRMVAGSADPLTADRAYDGSLTARLGLFNDGMLGSETDLGTYGVPGQPSPAHYGDKRSREAEIAFQNQLCAYVPNGGEVVIDNPYNDLSAAIQNLAASHVSYLNSGYDETVLSKWKESSFQGAAPFDGMNGYDYISRHLGYRYVLRSSEYSLPMPWEDTAFLTITLENTGFSNSYRSFEASLILKHISNGKTYRLPLQTDTRLWDTETKTVLEIPLHIHDYAPGEYQLFLHIADPVSGFRILMANEGAKTENGCPVGRLTIDKFP